MKTSKTTLSSLSSVPMTDETRRRLLAAGLEVSPALTEMGGQSLLALRSDGDHDDTPSCFQNEYDPVAALCAGCVFQPACWSGDLGYLQRLQSDQAEPPTGVPLVVVTERLNTMAERKPPPPAPRLTRDLAGLGYDSRQISRMTYEVRKTIIEKQIPAKAVSIGKSGDLHVVKKQMPTPPPPPKRKPPPPPPSRRTNE